MSFVLNPMIPQGTPQRLSNESRILAERYLNGYYSGRLTEADFNISELNLPENLNNNSKLACLSILIAQKTPLPIVPEEKLANSAPLLESVRHLIPGWKISSISHTTADFDSAIKLGLHGLEKELLINQKNFNSTEQKEFTQAMLNVIQAMRIWIKRYINAYQKLSETDSPQRSNYLKIISVLQQVPENPPRSFHEALQSFWSFFEFQRLCGNWSGLGRIDLILGDYLQHDLDNNLISLDEARELLAHFWIKGTEWCHGINQNNIFTPGSGDAQSYQNIILSGRTSDGHTLENPITFLILDIIEELHISDYPIAVRINRNTSETLLNRIAQIQLQGGGIVSVYNEDIVIDALTKFHFPFQEAVGFTNDGCWETLIPGHTSFSYTPFDGLQIFQQVLFDGRNYPTFDELFAAYNTALAARIKQITHDLSEVRHDPDAPAVTLSLLMPSCRQSGQSYCNRGTKYTVQGIHAGGLPDVANSLLAIKKIVFEQQRFDLNTFAQILKNNWQDQELLRQEIINSIPLYGNDNDEADQIMHLTLSAYAKIVRNAQQNHVTLFPCGISTFGREIEYAPQRCATAFGKFAHEYLAPNLSPTPGTEKNGAFAVLKSYCKNDFTLIPNGCPLDLRLDSSITRLPNKVQIVTALLKTFLSMGGFYLQLDVTDTQMLREAQKHPERFPNLAVRISGWSARFATLSKEWQDMIINRSALGIN